MSVTYDSPADIPAHAGLMARPGSREIGFQVLVPRQHAALWADMQAWLNERRPYGWLHNAEAEDGSFTKYTVTWAVPEAEEADIRAVLAELSERFDLRSMTQE